MSEVFREPLSGMARKMIWHPRKGLQVELRYRRGLNTSPYHGRVGVVLTSGKGPAPINALVELSDGRKVVVPRGNLLRVIPNL